MARCLRRKRLYEQYLVEVEQTLRSIYQQSDWPAVPGALEEANRRELLAPLEDILDTYVVYGVEMDLKRLKSSGVFRTDVKRPPTLDEVFAPPASPGRARSAPTDKKTLAAKEAYRRYFQWYIDGEVSQNPQQKKSGVKAFYERYPLLAHAVTTAAKHYGANIKLACDRVKENWQDIESAFFPTRKLAHLARIKTTGNDFHKGGKQVLILTFTLKDGSDGRVVYKPSGVEIDCRIVGNSKVVNAVKPGGYTQDQSLTEIINTYNPVKDHGKYTTKPLPTYVILPYQRDSVPEAYGYIEFLTHEPELPVRPGGDIPRQVAAAVAVAQGREDVVTKSDWIVTDGKDAWVFCYQLGALMATALAVSLCDLHVQNAIAHARLPHLIDLEEALKRPMATIEDTLLHCVAEEYSDPGTEELQIQNDHTDDLSVMWVGPPHAPATCTLYRYDPSKARPDRTSRVSVVAGDTSPAAALESALLRFALVCGVSDAVGAIAADECHKKITEWVGGLKETIARFVPWGTVNYLDKSRTLYWKFCMNSAPGAKAPADYGDYREFKNESGDQFFVQAAQPRRSQWEAKRKKKTASAEWNPYFAVEHPEHAWRDYLNGDVPAFYHKLGSRDLLNSRGEVVDVAAVNQWQATNLGVPPLAAPSFAKEYFPQTPIDMIIAQLDELKTACRSPEGKRDYLKKIMTGIKWLEGSPLDNLLPKLHARKRAFPFADADMRSLGDLVSDFLALDPLPDYKGKEEPAVRAMDFPDREVGLIQPSAPHSGKFAYAEELKNIPFPRVVAYGFRGDSRKPLEFKAQVKDAATGTIREWMQGFLPNYARPSHTRAVEEFKARPDVVADPDMKNPQWVGPDGKGRSAAEIDMGALDLRTYVANEFMGGYISLTRDAMVARSFACGMGGTPRSTPDAWVYCCLAEGAFNVPRKGQHPWATKNEAELAMPGMLEWEDIVGFREVTKDGQFTGPIYLRRSLQRADREVFTRLYKVFSGMNQSQITRTIP